MDDVWEAHAELKIDREKMIVCVVDVCVCILLKMTRGTASIDFSVDCPLVRTVNWLPVEQFPIFQVYYCVV